jgi:hypothetical protein
VKNSSKLSFLVSVTYLTEFPSKAERVLTLMNDPIFVMVLDAMQGIVRNSCSALPENENPLRACKTLQIIIQLGFR